MALSPDATMVFQTDVYRAAYRRHFGTGKRFHTLRVNARVGANAEGSAGDETQSERESGTAFLMTRGHLLRQLEWWGAGIHDIGGASSNSARTASALWREIERLAARHDGAHLAQVDARSALVGLAQSSGWQIEEAETCPVLALPDSWLGYIALLGKNMREQIRRYPKRLAKQFSVSYELAQSEDEMQRALADLFRLHGKRWRARGQTGVLALPSRQRFHQEVCRMFLRRGWLRLWTLRCNGQAACVLLCYCYAGRYYFFIGGFEPEMMRWSVGTCLFARVFQHAIEEGAHEFDFLRGAEEYKYRFGAIDRAYKTLSLFQPTARGRLLGRKLQCETAFMQRLHEKFSAAHAGKSS